MTSFNDAGSTASGAHFTGWSYSSDGGATFTDGGVLPNSSFGDAGDPVLVRNNTSGRIYLFTLGYSNSNTIPVFHSDDNGVTWSAPVNGTPGGSDEDKPWAVVDNFPGPGQGNVYLLSRRFGTGGGIYFFKSTDNGATFGPSGGTQIINSFQGAYIAVGPDHSIYAFYWASTSLKMRRSTDLGATFGAAVTVATLVAGGVNGDLGLVATLQGDATPQGFRTSKFPHAAVNPVSGNIYVTYNNDPAGADKADIFFVQSTDNGATWSAPVRVNDDATTTDQWQPTVAVSPDGQHIGFFYYSRQEDPVNNDRFKYYGRTGVISGGTVTLAPSFPVSSVASLAEFGRDDVVNDLYMGDYNTVSATNTDFHVVWSDNRDNLAGGGNRKDPNVYYQKVAITAVDNEPPKITCPGDITQGNDAGLCAATVNVGTATATDNSGTVTITGVRSDGKALNALYPVGTTTIEWTATDPSTNSAKCTQTITVNDTEKPNTVCQNVTVTLVNGTATITAADVNNGSTDNCGIQSVSIDKKTFSCADVGANTVTLTVTDIHGNQQTCAATVTVIGEVPTCTITSVPADNTYTGGVPTNIYLGYGPQSTTLQVSAPSSGAPYTYSWSPSTGLSNTTSSAPAFTPTTGGTYTFTVMVTNKYGCSNTCTITICVLDIRVPGTKGKKVYVCHTPPGNPGNANTLELNVSAVPAHIFNPGHGDHLGTCDQVICTPQNTLTTAMRKPVNDVTEGIEGLQVFASPNPTTNAFTVQIASADKQPVTVRIVDLYGRTVLQQTNVSPTSTLRLGEKLTSGLYMIEVIQGNKSSKLKLLKAN